MDKIGEFTSYVDGSGEFFPGDAGNGYRATPLMPDYFNMIQRELMYLLTTSGVTPDKTNSTQIYESIIKLVGPVQGYIFGRMLIYSGTPNIIRIPIFNTYEVSGNLIKVSSEKTLNFATITNIYRTDGITQISTTAETQSKHLYILIDTSGNISAQIIPDGEMDTGDHSYLGNPDLIKDALSASPLIYDNTKNGYYKNSKRIIATIRLNSSNQVEFVYELGSGYKFLDTERLSIGSNFTEWRFKREHPSCFACDGSTIVNMSTDFQYLYKILGTNVLPNTVDRVARSIDLASGRTLRDTEEDAIQGHWHNFSSNPVGFTSGSGNSADNENGGSGGGSLNDRVKGLISDGVNGTPRTANETRMKNFSLIIQITKG